MRQIVRIIKETKYDPKVIAWEIYLILSAWSITAHVAEWLF